MTALQIAKGFDLPLDLVTEATGIVATRGAGKSSTSAVLVEEAHALDVQAVVLDRTGVYWGLTSDAKGTRAGLPFYVLGGPHGDVPLEPHAGQMVADLIVDTGHSFVLDLSDLSKSGAVRFAADLLERLYDRKARSRSTLLLVVDEAHFYAPQTPRGGFKGDAARLMGAMEDVVGLGRSRGLGVVLTTQRTQALNKAILDLIETLVVMRMLSPRARGAVRDWIQEKHEDDERGVIASLDSLPTGTAWVWSPLRHILEKVPIRRIRTFDSYATPKPGESRVEPTKRAKLDLDALGAQMKSTVERAKENDPAELRRRIKELEARGAHDTSADTAAIQSIQSDLNDALARVRELEAREPDTVSVLTDDDRAKLVAITRHFEEAHAGIVASYEALGEVLGPLVALPTHPPRRPVVQKRGGHQPTADGPPPTVPPPKPTPPAGSNGHDPSLSGPQQRILDVLAWFEAIGIDKPRRPALAGVAGTRSTSGGFKANVSTLSGRDLVRYPDAGRVQLTDHGRTLAAKPQIAPTERALQEAVLATVSGPQAAILRHLIDRYPGSESREAIAQAVGVSPTSGGFKANVSTLSGLELVEYPDPGHVRAADLLFLG